MIAFEFRVTSVNAVHTRVSVFVGGHNGTLALCGTLVMRNDEYAEWVDLWLAALKERPGAVTFVPLSDEIREIGT